MTQGSPTVSVVIACYNAAPFIEQALASIVATAYTSLEIVVVDDGSTDGSPDIVRRFAEQNPQTIIRFIPHPQAAHRGQVATKNLGIRSACGRYVAFLDADDLYRPNRFRVCLDLLDQNPDADAVCEPYAYKYDEGERSRTIRTIVEQGSVDQGKPTAPTPGPANMSLFEQVLRGIRPVHVSSMTVRRDTLLCLGGFPDLYTSQDMALWLKLFARNRVLEGQKEPVSLYFLHDQSHCARSKNTAAFYLNPVLALVDALAWMKHHRSTTPPEYAGMVSRSIEGRYYAYGSRLHHLPHGLFRDWVRPSYTVLRAMPSLLFQLRFLKVFLRVIAVDFRLARPWQMRSAV